MQKTSRWQKHIQRNPWLTKGILTPIKQKQKLYRTYFLNGDALSTNFFKTYSNKLTRVKMYHNSTINKYKNKPKELWKFINSVIPNKHLKSLSIPKLINDGIVTDDLTEISEQFNNYFVKIGRTIANNVHKSDDSDFKSYLKHSISSTIVLDPPQPVEIFNVINSLNPHTASGYDNISAYFLRLGNEVLAPILTAYFTWAFEKGIFPCTLKTAKVIPIFKTGNKNSVNNYRPISLLPSLSNVLEKLIKIRFVTFFDKYDILYDYQYGFREGHSVLHSLLDVTSFDYDSIQNKENIAMLLMDLRKVFDTISHNILLQKLYHYGIRGPAHKLIESYLTSRKQFLSIDNVNSSA